MFGSRKHEIAMLNMANTRFVLPKGGIRRRHTAPGRSRKLKKLHFTLHFLEASHAIKSRKSKQKKE